VVILIREKADRAAMDGAEGCPAWALYRHIAVVVNGTKI
jgi:hypothetical protein